MSALESLFVLASVAFVTGYHIFFLWELRRRPGRTVIGSARRRRAIWVEQIVASGDGILAVQTLRNWTMSATLLASTAILIAAGLLGFLASADKSTQLIHELNLLGGTESQLFAIKILLLVANFLAVLFNFSLTLRHYNYVALTINSGAAQNRQEAVAEASLYLSRGAAHYSLGMRGYYLAIPLLLWLFGPVWLATGTVILSAGLYWHDHVR